MTNEITYRDVLNRIESSAKEIIENNGPSLPKENTLEDWESYVNELESFRDSGEVYDYSSEEIDGWDWSVYTHMGFQVYDALFPDDQREAESIFANMGGYETSAERQEGPYELGASMAYFWLIQALEREVDSQIDELLEMANAQLENMES